MAEVHCLNVKARPLPLSITEANQFTGKAQREQVALGESYSGR